MSDDTWLLLWVALIVAGVGVGWLLAKRDWRRLS